MCECEVVRCVLYMYTVHMCTCGTHVCICINMLFFSVHVCSVYTVHVVHLHVLLLYNCTHLLHTQTQRHVHVGPPYI